MLCSFIGNAFVNYGRKKECMSGIFEFLLLAQWFRISRHERRHVIKSKEILLHLNLHDILRESCISFSLLLLVVKRTEFEVEWSFTPNLRIWMDVSDDVLDKDCASSAEQWRVYLVRYQISKLPWVGWLNQEASLDEWRLRTSETNPSPIKLCNPAV